MYQNPLDDGSEYTRMSYDQSSGSYSNLVCDATNISNAHGSGFNPISGSNDMEHAIGISLDGVMLFPNLLDFQGNTVDVWLPDYKDAPKDWKSTSGF